MIFSIVSMENSVRSMNSLFVTAATLVFKTTDQVDVTRGQFSDVNALMPKD